MPLWPVLSFQDHGRLTNAEYGLPEVEDLPLLACWGTPCVPAETPAASVVQTSNEEEAGYVGTQRQGMALCDVLHYNI